MAGIGQVVDTHKFVAAEIKVSGANLRDAQARVLQQQTHHPQRQTHVPNGKRTTVYLNINYSRI